MPSLLDSVQTAGNQVGRYFSLVTLVPTTVLTVYTFALFKGGGGTRDFTAQQAFDALASIGLSETLALAFVSALLAFVTHPLQFAMTQLMEGYWGPAGLPTALRSRLTLRHIHKLRHFDKTRSAADEKWGNDTIAFEAALAEGAADARVRAYVRADAAQKRRDAYPGAVRRVMPTRLGNILRRFEDSIGSQYSLDIITVFPHLSAVAAPARAKRADDEAEQMDFALRMTAVTLAATAVTLLLLAPAGWWAMGAVVPYTLSYLSYRGACSSAQNWMQAVAVMVDLDRFTLYDALGVPRPVSHEQEVVWLGRRVTELLNGTITTLWYTEDDDAQYLPDDFPPTEVDAPSSWFG